VNTAPRLALAAAVRDLYLLAIFAISIAAVVAYNYRPNIYMKF